MNDSLLNILIKVAVQAQAVEAKKITPEEKKAETVKIVKENWDILLDLERERILESGAI